MSGDPLVDVTGLTVRIPTRLNGRRAWVHAATDVSTTLSAGRLRALVGESGCGKSILGSALLGLLPPGTRTQGAVRLAGQDVLSASAAHWRRLRGRTVALVTQSAATSLTPTRTVGSQLVETIEELGADATPGELLGRVGLASDALACYPHELSGGMSQRAALAFALVGSPRVIVADEPTASLDPDLTDHVLRLLRGCADGGAAVLLITHDVQSLTRTGAADDVSVMYAGRIVEQGPAGDVLHRPQHPYTRALLGALPEHGLVPIPGMPPSLTDLDPGTSFETRLQEAR